MTQRGFSQSSAAFLLQWCDILGGASPWVSTKARPGACVPRRIVVCGAQIAYLLLGFGRAKGAYRRVSTSQDR